MPVYFAQVGEGGPVKIGFTLHAPKRRVTELQISNHEKIKLLRTIDGGVEMERYLHKRFAANRIRGEWFRFSEEMLTDNLPPSTEIPKIIRARMPPRDPALLRAILAAGGVSALSRALGLTVQTVSQWNDCPAERAIAIEAITGGEVTKYELVPSVFGPPPKDAA